MKQFNFSASELESNLHNFDSLGITFLSVSDNYFACNRSKLIHLLKSVQSLCPALSLSILVEAKVLDKEVCNIVSEISCALEIPFSAFSKDNKTYLFDKKLYASRAKIMNDLSIIFDFILDYAITPGDCLKRFRERLDFAIAQYPNSIIFPETESAAENAINNKGAKVSAFFSARDIRYARDISFACRTFYSAGRAVSWFLAILKPLKLQPNVFFQDFAEWQITSNCDYKSGFIPENVSHKEIEKMQLSFLKLKYEEKCINDLFEVAKDIIKINGAFSRSICEKENTTLETSYSPDDLLSYESLDIVSFYENVCLNPSVTNIFATEYGVDYKKVD